MPRTSRNTPDTIELTVALPPSASERTVQLGTSPFLPWPLAAGVGGALAAGVGWMLAVGVALVAWFSALPVPLPDLLALCSRLWLLAHGGPMLVGSTTVTLIPLGLTACGLVMAWVVGRYAGGQAVLARPAMRAAAERAGVAVGIAGLAASGYAVIAVVMVLAAGGADRDWTPVLVAFGIALAGSAAGAAGGVGLRVRELRPVWLGAPIAGGAAGALALLAGAAVVLGVATLQGAERIGALEASLKLDLAGSVVWGALAVAYLPNALLWALAWALGGGFTVGTGSLVSLSGTHLGMLPAVPLLGALPAEGVAPELLSLWMVCGAVAGLAAGAVAVLRLGGARASAGSAITAVGVSLAAGVLTSAVLLAGAWASRGDLGSLRLVGLGPRLAELAGVATPMIVFCALLGGIVCWAVGAVRRAPA